MPTGKLHIVPLGGLGEFGMNCMAVRWGEDILVIDAGLMFPESELLGDVLEVVPCGRNSTVSQFDVGDVLAG